MPIRQKLRRAFARSSGSSNDSSLTTASSRNDSSVFQPGEPMPRPKYRAPVDKKHKELLESFSFPQSFDRPLSRRNSAMSLVSPGGTRLPSRNHSVSEPAHMRRRAALQATHDEDDDEDDLMRATSIFYAGPKDGSSSSSDDSSTASSLRKEKSLLAATAANARDHVMFSGNDFALAIERNRMGAASPLMAH